ncbi:MAG TPA: mandelate racemase/muconate lactonizing enzyme family protein [Pirellulales bacterium]|jgi:L-alanine-DL-glutamate epimerase-like enolase superfamily enzyme
MKIADLDFYLLDPAGGGADSPERTLLVRVVTADGREGWGESHCVWRASELAPRRESLLPILAGRSVSAVEELLEMEALAPPALRAAIEMACWDLIGRLSRQPLCRMWGGEYRPRVPLAMRLPVAPPERAAPLSREFDERGFHTQIVVATGNLEEDMAAISAVRDAAPGRMKLRVDGRGRFAVSEARELCRRLERTAIEMLIDPLDSGLEGVAELARQTSVPLAISAAIRSPADILSLWRRGAAPHLVIDIAVVGGLWPARQCAIVAAATQLPASLRGGAGLGVALAGMLQLAAAVPNLALAHEYASYQLHEDVLRDRSTVVDGTVSIDQGPGLGVEIDRARIEKYLVT